jgi:hypothetical protein
VPQSLTLASIFEVFFSPFFIIPFVVFFYSQELATDSWQQQKSLPKQWRYKENNAILKYTEKKEEKQ